MIAEGLSAEMQAQADAATDGGDGAARKGRITGDPMLADLSALRGLGVDAG
jgi:hypothetical protein